MHRIKGDSLLHGALAIAGIGRMFRNAANRNPPGDNAIPQLNYHQFLVSINNLCEQLRALSAPLSLECADEFLRVYKEGIFESSAGEDYVRWDHVRAGMMAHQCEQLNYRLSSELKGVFLLAVAKADMDLFDQTGGLFGDEVDKKFSDAIEDISEAGKCLAVRRYTACVFHLMRAMESAISHLATDLNATVADRHGQRWSRLSEQIFRIDKWSVCRG